jgi:cytochrome c
MKKWITLALLAGIIFACGSNSSTDNASGDTPEKISRNLSKNPDYQKGLALIAKSDCLTCHKVGEKAIGPAYKEVAAKYPDTEENIAKLAATIINGSSGVWGEVPMTAHPTLSEEDARAMVKYILLLN